MNQLTIGTLYWSLQLSRRLPALGMAAAAGAVMLAGIEGARYVAAWEVAHRPLEWYLNHRCF